ncbi:MAG TPA: hypothetical protein PKE69_02410 [Pyrinomonadaceae bacterium]|nr:hypothetical protein [Pyrinomonadaceae bacterium]
MSAPNLIKLLGASCIVIVLTVVSLVFLSEKFTGAEIASKNSAQPNSNPTPNNSSPTNTKIYADALEKVRNEYANVKSVEMDSTVTIDIIKSDSVVSGTGQINYVAKGNKYKYVCAVSDNLVNEGLMRNVDVLFAGDKYYFYDRESKIVSFQSSEEIRSPSALPNPFFLPLDYLSNDDDSCENCKLRLHDVRMPTRWAKRISSISEILRENTNVIHSIIEMPGGEM